MIRITSRLARHYRLFSTQQTTPKDEFTSFGYEQVKVTEKQEKVNEVFSSVADSYDLMNDVLSLGIHRCWKDTFVSNVGAIRSQNGSTSRVLDVAGGTGDIAFRILKQHQSQNQFASQQPLQITVLDINREMLRVGQGRAFEQGIAKEGKAILLTNNNRDRVHPWRRGRPLCHSGRHL